MIKFNIILSHSLPSISNLQSYWIPITQISSPTLLPYTTQWILIRATRTIPKYLLSIPLAFFHFSLPSVLASIATMACCNFSNWLPCIQSSTSPFNVSICLTVTSILRRWVWTPAAFSSCSRSVVALLLNLRPAAGNNFQKFETKYF